MKELSREEKSIVEKAKSDGCYMKAPNGEVSMLTEKEWAQVRTPAFKVWFGDWEKAYRIEKLKKSEPICITGEEYKGRYELNRASAQDWILSNLRGEYKISDTGETVMLSKVGAKKVTSHSMGNVAHLKSIAIIPQLIENAIFITDMPNNKGNGKYDNYRYYVVGLKKEDDDYTARLTIGVKDGRYYYDHYLTEIEKGNLIEIANGFTPTGDAPIPSYTIGKDTKLLSILQTIPLKYLDKNGEPLATFVAQFNDFLKSNNMAMNEKKIKANRETEQLTIKTNNMSKNEKEEVLHQKSSSSAGTDVNNKNNVAAKTKSNTGQTAIDRFAEMMIGRMEQMKASDWEKGWIGGAGYAGMPENISGRNYSGSNSFFLQMHSAANGYNLPVFMTFKQAQSLDSHVLKGEKGFPVIYWDIMVKDQNGRRVDIDKYRAMSNEEKKGYDVIPFIKSFSVYNVAQTNFADVHPERMARLEKQFKLPELKDTNGMYTHAAMDRMVATQEWLCPIKADTRQDGAYYSPSKDIVVVPMKAQFNKGNTPQEVYRDGMEYYSTMLHEMTHSTMKPERLNREVGSKFGDSKYAKEELVAELTAAMISHSMGFDSKITDNSAAYLDAWIGTLKKEPKFIVSVMADVNKASDLILEHVDKQRLALGEQPYLTKNVPAKPVNEEDAKLKNTAIVKTRSGDYAIRASYDGVDMGMKPISKDTAKSYFRITDMNEKQAFLNATVHKTYSPEISAIKQERKSGPKMGLK